MMYLMTYSKPWEKDVLRLMKQLLNNIHETGERPKSLIGVAMISLKKKPKATKCSDHRTISLITHTAKIVGMIFRRRIERKIEDIFGGDQFGLRRQKSARHAVGMLRVISGRILDIDNELCACFIDWQTGRN
jgi:hypothetical protein